MFGLFERGNRTFSIFLLLVAIVLVFFTSNRGIGPFTLGRGTNKNEEEEVNEEEKQEKISVLYSRPVGKDPEIETEDGEEKEYKEDKKTQVLYSRSLGKVEDNEQAQVLYTRTLS